MDKPDGADSRQQEHSLIPSQWSPQATAAAAVAPRSATAEIGPAEPLRVMIPPPDDLASRPSLELEATEVLSRFRSALARIFATLPAGGRRPATVAKALGLHQTLAWKLVQVVKNPDPFAAVQHMPGDSGIEIFLRAAADSAVPEPLVAAVRSAATDFQRLVESHAGDRASLQMMLAGLARSPASPVELALRKSGMRCASYVWGVQCKVRVKSAFLRPSASGDTVDVASLRGFVGFRRIRPNTPWTISVRHYVDQEGAAPRFSAVPIDPALGPDDVPLLRPFCTHPLPEIVRVDRAGGAFEYQLAAAPVGDQSAITLFLGDLMRDTVSPWADPVDRGFDNGQQNRVPTETLILDTFWHRSLWNPRDRTGRQRAEAVVISELDDEPWYNELAKRPSDYLPFPERLEHLGSGAGAAHTPDLPQYPDLVEHTLGHLRWRPEEFELYRLRIEYPVLRTAAVARFSLIDPPTGK